MRVLSDALLHRKFFDDRPITWNAPANAFGESGISSTGELRSRIAGRQSDSFLPMGLTGAPHQLLTERESESEIEWALSNPWQTGSVDCGFRRPTALLLRADSVPVLAPAPLPVISPARFMSEKDNRASTRNARKMLAVQTDGRQVCLPTIDSHALDTGTAEAASRGIARISRHIRRAWAFGDTDMSLAMLVVVHTPETLRSIDAILDSVAALCERGTIRLEQLPGFESWHETTMPILPWIPASAADPAAQGSAARIRKPRTTRLSRKQTLELIATGTGMTDPEHEQIGHRNFDASMMGEVTLAGPGMDALFSGGRFSGFGEIGTEELIPARNFLRCAGSRPRDFEAVTCFSFESEEASGLRSVEVIVRGRGRRTQGSPSEATRLVSDFSFVSNLPVLVSSHAFFPGPDTTDHCTELLHLTRSLPEEFNVEVQAARGAEWEQPVRFSDSDHEREVFGTRFTVHLPDGPLCVAFLTTEGLPLVSSVGVYRCPQPMLAIGGRFDITSSLRTGMPAEIAMIIAQGSDAAANINGVLSGRIPRALQRELLNGPGSTQGAARRV